MGLACANIRLLTLTARKADLEYGISIDSMEKMALSREMNELTREYNSKLSAKNICYYNNGHYNKINYNYLMGNTGMAMQIMQNDALVKENYDMILTDYRGMVVLSDSYANAIKAVCGNDIMDSSGRGGTFSQENIAEIIASFVAGYDADDIRNGIESCGYTTTTHNTMSGETTGTSSGDAADGINAHLQNLIDFYYPIFQAAASNGWTTEYNTSIANNEDYVSDALTSGTFQLFGVNNYGQYDEGTSLNYFVTSGCLESKSDADARKELEAWYEQEKAIITDKETMIDMEITDFSTELESVKTMIESIKSFIDDACQSVFDWGQG